MIVTIMHSRWTDADTGTVCHQVFFNSQPVIPQQAGEGAELFAADYARALYHQQRGKRRLVFYNSDTQTQTVLDGEPLDPA